MKEYVISESVLQGIVNYLALQTYGEVYQLIAGLQKLQPVPPVEYNGPQEIPEEPEEEA